MDLHYIILFTTVILQLFDFNVECTKYERCEFLKVLTDEYHLEPSLAQSWTCLGEKITGLDTNFKIKGINTTLNGIFQVSSEYWCVEETDKKGKGCDINCLALLDDDLSDDLECVQKIFNQHSGFSAWPVYETACKDIDYHEYFKECDVNVVDAVKPEKIYEKCEFVRELYTTHAVPMEMLGVVTCIAKEESQFNTAAVGRLNNDKSLDHGIFQISDKFWCLNDEKDENKAGNNCNIPCSSLRDDDITDDVRCMKQIYEQTSKFSESGYDAWLVYSRNDSVCKDHEMTNKTIEDCFDKNVSLEDGTEPKTKSFQRCELVEKLKSAGIPSEDIPTFVCIAYHESKLTTSKVSNDKYGIFQILEGKWCSSNDISAVGCEISCDRLRDTNVTDDIECVKKIHALLGFSAWDSYKNHCDGDRAKKFTESCRINESSKNSMMTRTTTIAPKAGTIPYYLLHFSDPENAIRATLEIGKSNVKEGAGIKVIPILSTKNPNKMSGLSVIIED